MGDDLSDECQILWIDFRYSRNKPCLDDNLMSEYGIQIIDNSNVIDSFIESINPKVICFDFDLPDRVGLDVLQKTKTKYPLLPLLIITDDHSLELSIWALRSRVWDYFLKPVSLEEILASVNIILKKNSEDKTIKGSDSLLQPKVPSVARPYNTSTNRFSTSSAIDYVKQNLADKIAVENVALRCGMSKSHFSRTFKKEHDITFQEFLIQQRMNKAVKLLKNSDLHVTQIALAVGYCELSNFTSTFQRIIGIRPSSFRKALMPKHFKNQLYN